MKIRQEDRLMVVEDGAAAHYGMGVLVPAALVSILMIIIWPPGTAGIRFDLGALAFFGTTLVLALLNPPRKATFDLQRREVRLFVGWPPMLGRRKTIPFDTIRDVQVSQFLRLSDNLGSARPALVLTSGKKILLSTYKRSPKRCRKIIEQVRPFLGAGSHSAST